MRSLSKIKTLEEVALSQTSVTNAALPALAQLPELAYAGVERHARHERRDWLRLWRTPPNWKCFRSRGKNLSREDLQDMAKLKQFKTIVLNGVPLPDATMAQLKQLGTPSPWDSIADFEKAQRRSK